MSRVITGEELVEILREKQKQGKNLKCTVNMYARNWGCTRALIYQLALKNGFDFPHLSEDYKKRAQYLIPNSIEIGDDGKIVHSAAYSDDDDGTFADDSELLKAEKKANDKNPLTPLCRRRAKAEPLDGGDASQDDDVEAEAQAEAVTEKQTVSTESAEESEERTESETEEEPTILDSGERRVFHTGAVRDIQEGKGRCDLMPLGVVARVCMSSVIDGLGKFKETGDTRILYNCLVDFADASGDGPLPQKLAGMMLEVSKHFEDGAKKYGENNWQKGIPCHCYLDSAVRHYLKHMRGDTDEHHDRAFVWNIMCLIWTAEHIPDMIDLKPVTAE